VTRRTHRPQTGLERYADPHVAYMFHCHIFEHEDHGMMGQFVVVEEDTPAEEIYIKSDLNTHNEAHNH